MKKLKHICIGIMSSILLIITLLYLSLFTEKDINNNIITPSKEKVEYRDKINRNEVIHNPNNRITIEGVLNNRIMDDDGSYYYLDHNLDGIEDQIGMTIVETL